RGGEHDSTVTAHRRGAADVGGRHTGTTALCPPQPVRGGTCAERPGRMRGMAPHPVPSSGVLGAAARVAVAGPIRSADLRLAGAPLPGLGPAGGYTCGITPYDVTHLGHAATFVWADALRGVLEMAGAEVISSRNVTDVDDVLTRAADAKGRHDDEFALSQEFLFERDMEALAVHRPTHAPRARYYVMHVQQLAAALLGGGRAYERKGHVFFRGADVPERAGLDRAAALALSESF